MAIHDPVADQITTLYEQCRRPRREQRIQQRWTRYPALAGSNLADIAASPKPFMVILLGHIRRDATRYHASQTRGFIPAGDTDTEINDHIDNTVDDSDATEQAAIARICLARIASHVRAGDRGDERWQELIHHSFAATVTTVGSARRIRVQRLRRDLADLTARTHPANTAAIGPERNHL